jgi:GMP synthase (glutamine-hydrolysing)
VPILRHLLRRPAHRPAARRRGRPHRQGRVRPHRADRRRPQRREARRPARPDGVDEPLRLDRACAEGFAVTAATPVTPVAAWSTRARRIYGVQFHPEVVHTPHGQEVLERFLYDVAGCRPTWTMTNVIDTRSSSSAQVGDERVICGLSAASTRRWPRPWCTRPSATSSPACSSTPACCARARPSRWSRPSVAPGHRAHPRATRPTASSTLAGVTDPEEKRKAIGELFIRVFEERPAGGIEDASSSCRARSTPTSSSPARPRGQDQEPPQRGRPARGHAVRAGRAAAALFKDEVRAVGESSACPRDRVAPAVPRPGPGRAHHRRGHARAVDILQRPTRSCARSSAPPGSSARSGRPGRAAPTSAPSG